MDLNKEKISLNSLIEYIPKRKHEIDCSGFTGSEKAYLVSKIYSRQRTSICVLVPSEKDAEKFIEDLSFFTEGLNPPLLFFPPYNILPFKNLSYHNETAAARINTLYRLLNSREPPILVTTAGAMLQKLIPKNKLSDFAELIMEGEEISLDLLIEKITSCGYSNTVLVEEPGDFSKRGGILDIFSPLYQDPVRIEFFGDTVDSIRFFSAATQKKIKTIPEVIILPAREGIIEKKHINHFLDKIRKQALALDISVSVIKQIQDRIKQEGTSPGIDSLLSIIYPELDTIYDYLPDTTLFILSNPGEIEKAGKDVWEQAVKNYLTSCREKRLCDTPENLYLQWQEAKEILLNKKTLNLKLLSVPKQLSGSDKRRQSAAVYNFELKDNTAMRTEIRNFQNRENLLLPLVEWINDKIASRKKTIIVCSAKAQINRLETLLIPYGIHPETIERFSYVRNVKGIVYLCEGHVSSGFVWPSESLAIITEDEIFGAKHRSRKKRGKKKKTSVIEFADLKKGDLVVHLEHGIGRYEGLVKIKLNGIANDFLLILYRDNDKLYLPVDRMGMAGKYMGVEGVEPVLDKMGGKSWDKVKQKITKSAEKIAGKLLKIYAERSVHKGYAFKKTDSYFRDFEAGFPYEETEDQLQAIDDVLADMEQPVPMDRLICGDVGYGKTEVALRASFKAVSEGKQVAVLVPTTVLAEQHFATFSERFNGYPFTIECLSRFRSLKKQKEIIHGLESNSIDIVIGTHRLIQKDVTFKDMGLFVIDEEQRFGVKDKEKIKRLRTTVDVLALTATPIPRTLHLSLMGMRDISIISTPPEQRQGIITYICKFDTAIITEAVRKELKRGGQIFFIHNNVNSIWAITKKIKGLVPEVRIDVAHGRLKENDLEKVMLKFIRKEIDLLVCTTIVESGLDIPSANTIIINRADRFGLAQMYQLRGRVGRTDEQAYAYLFIPDESILSKNAQKRLKVLMEYSDLGYGFQIALNDLKIRGGGTILGSSQSGHIAAIGYDMFLQLMEKAIAKLKGEPIVENLEPEINLPLSCFIPESYLPDIDQRLSLYRRLAKIIKLQDIANIKNEVTDRFGALPVEASNLLLKIILKVSAREAGVKRLDLSVDKIKISFSEAHQNNPSGIVNMIAADSKRFNFTPDHVLHVRLKKNQGTNALAQAKNILKDITQYVNN